MNEFEKLQLISEAAAILILHAESLKNASSTMSALSMLINRLVQENPEIIEKYSHEITSLHNLVQLTQHDIHKTGTAQSLFIEDIKSKFGIGGGIPKNVRKGNVRKKD